MLKNFLLENVAPMSKWLKQPILLGNIAYYCFRALNLSLNIKVYKDPNIDPMQPYLFAFWHGQQLLPSFVLTKHHFSPMCAMVSPSNDGAILATYLQKCGFDVLRGSSRDKSVRALVNMKKLIAVGTSIGFAVDGPIGPIYKVKPGIIYLSQKYDIPIITMSSVIDNKWVIQKAWDKFQIPKPFAKCGLYLDTPYKVDKAVPIEEAVVALEKKLHASTIKAKEWLLG